MRRVLRELRAFAVLLVLHRCFSLAERVDELGEAQPRRSVLDTLDTQAVDPSQGRAQGARRLKQPYCQATLGTWCSQKYAQQQLLPWKVPPTYNKACPKECSGVGVCNAMTGLCDCPAGWGGDDCASPLKRPCTNAYAEPPRTKEPQSHIGPDKRDLNWTNPGSTYSRCAGICDDDIGACYCDGERHGRIPHPPGAPPSIRPIREGRLLFDPCSHLSDDGNGTQLQWVHPGQARSYEHVYGPEGWCTVDRPPPNHRCLCQLDGLGGEFCDLPVEAFCPNQCSGKGWCHRGFCHCEAGWFGADCASRQAQPGSLDSEEACVKELRQEAAASERLSAEKPWLRMHVADQWLRALNGTCGAGREGKQVHEGSRDEAAGRTRRRRGLLHRLLGRVTALGRKLGSSQPRRTDGRPRPLIYVYDTPSLYMARQLQYRMLKQPCTWRLFDDGNRTWVLPETVYGVEAHLHELLLQSQHRTLDPEEADFFYVPVYMTCQTWPVNGWADYPWFYVDSYFRVKQVAIMARDLKRWVETTMPYWNRTQGRDHIWLFPHDEGACWAPAEVYNTSIILTHWGRTDIFHISGTSYGQDNYSIEVDDDPYFPDGYRKYIDYHPCYTPGKDLVIPLYKSPDHYESSPFLGAEPVKRDIWMLFRGAIGVNTHPPGYSRNVRQTAYNMSKEHNWKERYNIWVGTREDIPGSYSKLMARSVFCLVAAGDGWSSRFDDAMLHGCIPLIAIDSVHGPWHMLLDYRRFSVRIRQEEVPYIPEILARIPPQRIERMQRTIARIWHRFAWLSHPAVQSEVADRIRRNTRFAANRAAVGTSGQADGSSQYSVLQGSDIHHDAFHTILQWLYHRKVGRHKRAEGVEDDVLDVEED